jgi:hypothetical protein
MKQTFRENLGLNVANKQRLVTINSIIDEYAAQGYRLTLRQLYYQLVSRDIIPNQQKEYAKLSGVLVKGRMAGIVDWYAIEDRIRKPYIPYSVDGIDDAIKDTIDQYRLDRQDGQEVYIELWVEKDALSGVLRRITEKYHVNLMVNRGYSSCTAMYDASRRIKTAESDGKEAHIFYLGDHDPSGLDMVRDIRARLEEFQVTPEVHHIGLTSEQIKQYNPPPNPAKFSDPRAKDYMAKFGKTSWEVDALKPEVLHQLVEDSILEIIDNDLYESQIEQEEKDKTKLKKLIALSEKLEESDNDSDDKE